MGSSGIPCSRCMDRAIQGVENLLQAVTSSKSIKLV
nr:MAG TPA: hypothetical protein [Herelleviridae sp.]